MKYLNYIQIKFLLGILFTINIFNFAAAQNEADSADQSWSFHFQQTTVYQWHYDFDGKPGSDYSLKNKEEDAISLTSTIFIGRKLWKGANAVFNPELAGGSGLSQARGIAGFTNGETFRIGDPRPQVYLARLFIEQKIALDKKTEFVKGEANTVQGHEPTSYVSISAGKFSNADYFDCNQYSHDPRSQFLNWSLMSAGAWDYAANTRGYTYGFVLQYITPKLSLRYGMSCVPTVANGPELSGDWTKYQAQTFEVEKPYKLGKSKGIFRVLAYYNNAPMRSYNQAVKDGDLVVSTDPSHQANLKNSKYGLSANIEHSINNDMGLFARLSWNDGNNETWAFTEIDHSACLGLSISGRKWKRDEDILGIASVVNGISIPHQNYLKAGGNGFMIGDGYLNYAPEMITECYYSILLHEDHFWLTPNYQFVANPAYNSDRGPLNIFGLRLHAEF